jgi:hypothetical protein
VRNTLNELADFRILAPLENAQNISGEDTSSGKLSGPLLVTDNRVLLNKWFNQLDLYLRVNVAQYDLIELLKKRATGLILYYRKKHNLKN